MPRLAQITPILRLMDLLAGVTPDAAGRTAPRALMSEATQRLFVGPQWPARERLELLAELARLTADGSLPARERELAISELGRLALRVLWSEGLLGDALKPGTTPLTVAARLLNLAASDALPRGRAFQTAMKRAKDLLQRQDVIAEITAHEDLRMQLRDLLIRAEERREVVAV
jgi:hypothetical protein